MKDLFDTGPSALQESLGSRAPNTYVLVAPQHNTACGVRGKIALVTRMLGVVPEQQGPHFVSLSTPNVMLRLACLVRLQPFPWPLQSL